MYKDVYEIFKKSIESYLKTIEQSKEIFDQKKYTDEFLIDFQEFIIRTGEIIEKWPLKNKGIITLLEQICEDLYQLLETENPEAADRICCSIEKVDAALEDSCDVNEVELAFVCIIRNEARYIKEWINFHRIVGVKHFYIYDNESTDNIQEVLEPFIRDGIVDLIPYPGNFVQYKAYNDALKNYKYECKYMGFIDADEFVTPLIEDKKIYEIIDDLNAEIVNRAFFEKTVGFAGIGINWRIYGTSFHKEAQSGYLIDNYIYRAEDRYLKNCHIKSILDPRIDAKFEGNPHFPHIHSKHCLRSENGTILVSPWMQDARYDKIQITHYFMKSEEERAAKLRRGWPDRVHKEVLEDEIKRDLEIHKVANAVKDTYMQRFSKKLKEME